MSLSAKEILECCGGRAANVVELGGMDRWSQTRVEGAAALGASKPADVAFFFSKEFQAELMTANAGVLVTGEAFVEPMRAAGLPLFQRAAVIACADPYWAMAVITERIAGKLSSVAHIPGGTSAAASDVHPTAVVHPEAKLGAGTRVGPGCVVEAGAELGAGTVLYPGCYVGPKARLGRDCVLFPRVTVYEWTQIGERVRIHAGAVIGADGFGYAPRRVDGKVVGHQKIYHLGRVRIGDDVEIGANTCIDRGTLGDTVIERQAKIDNQVQIAHNCQVQEGAVICGCVGMAGSVTVGPFATIAGLAGVANKIHIGAGATVAAMTCTSKDVAPGTVVVGNPMREWREHFKVQAAMNRLLASRRRGERGDTKGQIKEERL